MNINSKKGFSMPIILGIVAVVIVVAGVVLFTGGNKATAPSDISEQGTMMENGDGNMMGNSEEKMMGGSEMMGEEEMMMGKNVIVFSDSGFSPATLTIKVGEAVTFKNESPKTSWPASAMHPTHRAYPGSDIEKCGTSEQSNIFDACKGIESGGSWTFTFNEAGSWKYHDHLNSTKFGTIVVEK